MNVTPPSIKIIKEIIKDKLPTYRKRYNIIYELYNQFENYPRDQIVKNLRDKILKPIDDSLIEEILNNPRLKGQFPYTLGNSTV